MSIEHPDRQLKEWEHQAQENMEVNSSGQGSGLKNRERLLIAGIVRFYLKRQIFWVFRHIRLL